MLPGLTARERMVAELVGRGLSNKEVARELGCSEGTVKIHLHSIYEKLTIKNRTVLALRVRAELLALVPALQFCLSTNGL
jgi:DNA-binding NarL/FixJ family response regulator